MVGQESRTRSPFARGIGGGGNLNSQGNTYSPLQNLKAYNNYGLQDPTTIDRYSTTGAIGTRV